MSLLDWIQRYKDSSALGPEDFKLAEALTIAVEALQDISIQKVSITAIKTHAKEALRRIEEIGK